MMLSHLLTSILRVKGTHDQATLLAIWKARINKKGGERVFANPAYDAEWGEYMKDCYVPHYTKLRAFLKYKKGDPIVEGLMHDLVATQRRIVMQACHQDDPSTKNPLMVYYFKYGAWTDLFLVPSVDACLQQSYPEAAKVLYNRRLAALTRMPARRARRVMAYMEKNGGTLRAERALLSRFKDNARCMAYLARAPAPEP